MREVVASRPGPIGEVLELRSAARTSAPRAGEVDVRMIASTINPSDVITISGAYGSRTTFPFVPGFEGLGVVERVGPEVPASAIGMRVLPIGSAGNWQELKRTEHSWCIPVPPDLTDTTACFAYINPLTAALMVRRHCPRPRMRVVITAATSTIAGHLAQLLSTTGTLPIGLTRGTPGSTVEDGSLWSELVDTSVPGWGERLRSALGGHGADIAFDCVGGEVAGELMRQIAPGGLLVHFGLLSGRPLPADCFTAGEGRRVDMFRLRDVIHTVPREHLPTLFGEVFDHLRAGRLHTRVGDRTALTELPAFLRGVRPRRGKLLIDCRD